MGALFHAGDSIAPYGCGFHREAAAAPARRGMRMTEQPGTTITPTAPAIMHELETLQRTHRLAIHVWEHAAPYQFPTQTYDHFKIVQEAPHLLHAPKHKQTPFLSMSLLPRADAQSPCSIVPYSDHEFLETPGYLVDLRQDDEKHRALVPRMVHNSLASGTSIYDKSFHLDGKTHIPEIDSTLMKHGQSEDSLIEFARTDAGARRTETQLSALGEIIHRTAPIELGNQVLYNELLVCASRQHIKAIVVPVKQHKNMAPETNAACVQLIGALAGMQHLNNGVDLPVVYYHIASDPHMAGGQQGNLSWLGQGHDELLRAAQDAVHTLQTHGTGASPKENFLYNMHQFQQGELRLAPLLNALQMELLRECGIDIAHPVPAPGHHGTRGR